MLKKKEKGQSQYSQEALSTPRSPILGMASSTSINSRVEELVHSFIPKSTAPAKARRHVEHFLRVIKHHNYARTNQFEVNQRLIGLEEKFQVLNCDELSDALRERRLALAQHHEPWLPEALHLQLELSDNPLKKDTLSCLSRLDRSVPVIPVVTWADIQGDEPDTRRDSIWQQPDFGGSDTDEDGLVESSPDVSPARQEQNGAKVLLIDAGPSKLNIFEPDPDPELASRFKKNNLAHRGGDYQALTEIQVMREVLFMVQGLPTSLFHAHGSPISAYLKHHLAHLQDESFNSILEAVIEISTPAREIRTWLREKQSCSLMQTFQSQVQEVISTFDQELNKHHQRLLEPANDGGGVASLLALLDSLRKQAAPPVVTIRNLLRRMHGKDPVDCLEIIHSSVSSAEVSSDRERFLSLLNIFQPVFKTYARLLERWVCHGTLEDQDNGVFFIFRAEDHQDKSNLWPAWFNVSKADTKRPPPFLASLADRILVAGKTRVFLRYLNHTSADKGSVPSLVTVIDHVCSTSSSSPVSPFAPTLYSCLEGWLTSHLRGSTRTLQNILLIQLNLKAAISSMSRLYFSSSVGHLADSIDSHIFGALDHASVSWNDRFRLTDIYTSSLGPLNPDLDVSRISISSRPVARSRLVAARRSVSVLSTIKISYSLPWTIANVLIPSVTNPSYQRISLFLQQIRRARYCLHRHALPALQSCHRGDQGLRSSVRVSAGRLIRPLRITDGLFQLLHTITTTLYAHLTDCVIDSMGQRLRTNIIDRGRGRGRIARSHLIDDIDDTIRLHQSYVQSLEIGCLTAQAKNISLVRATVIEILDICLAFSFGIASSSSSSSLNPDSDRDSNDEEKYKDDRRRFDNDGLGMSIEEIIELRHKTRRAINLLVAGLKGVARSVGSGSTTMKTTSTGDGDGDGVGVGSSSDLSAAANEASAFEMIDLLARRLELCQFK